MRRPLFAIILSFAITPPVAAQADAWWGHVTTLAHDSMRGRETGSPEHRRAAEYVAAAFQRAGLVPAGTDGWFQPVRFQVRRIAEGRSSLALVRGGNAETLQFGTDATINLRTSQAGKVDAPLVFIGYGVRSPEHGHDDLAGQVITDPEPERNAFVRSDQFSFIRRGIPALSLKVGFAVGSPEHDRVLRWRQERYHGIEDEVTQSVNRQAAEDFNRLYPEVVTEVANRPARPAWYPTSAFRPEGTGSN